MRSMIRWAGSKKTLLPVLRDAWNPETASRYVEPFCGSASLFFDLEPKAAILGDINTELIRTYRALKSDSEAVFERILQYRVSKTNYYAVRSINPATLSNIEVAARFLFLNRLCFNGIYRTSKAGNFNVPFAKPKTKIRFDRETFDQTASLLKHVKLVNADFEVVLDEARPGDFVYLDPPYAISKRRVFSEYHPDSFSESDLKRLDSALVRLDRKKIHFLISYGDSAEGRRLVSNWQWKRVRTRRNVAGFAGDRRAAYELLASNLEFAQ